MPQRLIYLALHTDYSEDLPRGTDYDEAKCGEIAVERLLKGDRGHYGPLEHPQLTLGIKTDHDTIMQLRTHRVGITFDVQSLRYTGEQFVKVANGDLRVDEVFWTRPPGKYYNRQGNGYDWTQEMVDEQRAQYLSACIDYKRWRELGVNEEHARQCIPHGHFQCAQISANLRTWLHLLDMRWKADAQFEVRQLMTGVDLEIQKWVPVIHNWYMNNRAKKAKLAP